MESVYLVGVQHDGLGNLMSSSMWPLIENQVIPLLSENSVLVVEGGKRRGKMTSSSPDYDVIYSQLGPICYSGLKPTIHSDDPQYWSEKDKDVSKYLQRANVYSGVVNSLVRFSHMPNTWEELVNIVKTGQHDVRMIGALSKPWQAFARQLQKEYMLRDDGFIEQVNSYLGEGKTVFFIGGVLHCISISARCGWPVIRYDCTPEQIAGFYRAWYQVYWIADILDRKQAK